MQTVRDHLLPDGAFSMYNYYRPDVFERYAATLTQVFGHAPCIDRGGLGAITRSQSVLTIGLEADSIVCDTPFVAQGNAPEPATDDHPFPYLRGRTIPSSYLVALALVLLASIVTVRVGSGRPIREMRPYLDLFFMGAAFLLLETKNVVQFALLFGTTWLVNSLVFAGILIAVLGAIEVARRFRLPTGASSTACSPRASSSRGSSGRRRCCPWSRSRGSSPRSRWRSRPCSWPT